MAKKKSTPTYKIYPNAKGDLYPKSPSWRKDGSGKFELNEDLTQKELEYIFNEGHTNLVFKIEG